MQMDIFSYGPMNLERPSLRLLQLLKGEKTDNIECELFQAYLDGDDLIPYHAVSYTWGGTEMCSAVTVNGRTLGVTENLYLALQSLRERKTDRVFWIDAICIDQGNERERGHQVQQMGSIYSQAEEVVIWLGSATYETNVLMDSLTQLKRKSLETAYKEWDLTDTRWKNHWQSVQPGLMCRYTDLTTLQREGLELLLSRPWSKRVWILQEVAKAKSAIVCSGDRSVPAHIFALAPLLLQTRPERHSQAVLDIMPGPVRKNSWWNEKRDLYTLLLKFGESRASDPRDMVYALLGISSDAFDADSLRPDYTKDNRHVIHDTTAFLFGSSTMSYRTMEGFLQHISSQNEPSFSQITKTCTPTRIADYLKHHGKQSKVTESVIKAAAANKKSGRDVMELLLKQHGAEVKITEAVVEAAANNRFNGEDVMELLLQQRSEGVEVTEGLVVKLARSFTVLPMKLLLQRHGAGVKITEAVVEAAAANEKGGKYVMELLLQRRGAEVKVTEAVVKAAASNRFDGRNMMELLMQHGGAEVEVTEAMVKAAAAN